MIEVGFTGTRAVLTLAQHTNLVAELKSLRERTDLMVNGCCEGSDRIAWLIWRDLGGRFRYRPGDRDQWLWARDVCREQDDLFAPTGYMDRNTAIARSDVVVATPHEDFEVQRSGTWSTVRRARRANSSLVVLLPCGQVNRERASV